MAVVGLLRWYAANCDHVRCDCAQIMVPRNLQHAGYPTAVETTGPYRSAVDPCYNHSPCGDLRVVSRLPAARIAFLATGSSASNLSLKTVPLSSYLRLEKMGLQFSTRLRPFVRAWAIDWLVLD